MAITAATARTNAYPDTRTPVAVGRSFTTQHREFGVAHKAGSSVTDGNHPLGTSLVATCLEVLDSLNIGVAVTNGSRQVLFINQTSERILLARDGLDISPQGVLYAVDRSVASLLNSRICQAATPAEPGPRKRQDSLLAVERSSGKRPLTLLIRPLHSHVPDSEPSGPAVLVHMLDPDLPVRDAASGLRQLFGLTASEAELARLLMEGRALDDCCTQLRIRTSTARMHLGNVFAKTGVQRQSQLVSLLWKSVGMICTEG